MKPIISICEWRMSILKWFLFFFVSFNLMRVNDFNSFTAQTFSFSMIMNAYTFGLSLLTTYTFSVIRNDISCIFLCHLLLWYLASQLATQTIWLANWMNVLTFLKPTMTKNEGDSHERAKKIILQNQSFHGLFYDGIVKF